MVHEQWTDSGEPHEESIDNQADQLKVLDDELLLATKELDTLNAEEKALHWRQMLARQRILEALRRREGLLLDFSAINALDHARYGQGENEHYDVGRPTITGDGSAVATGVIPFGTYEVQAVVSERLYFTPTEGYPIVRSVRVDDFSLEPPQPPAAA